MKTRIRLLVSCLVAVSAAAYGGNIPALDVTVSDPGGKLAYRGRTSANGTFSTGNLAPGAYVVVLNSKNSAELKGNRFAVVVAAGKKKVSANGVAGEKFSGGGVAMKVDVTASMKVTGQVANAAAMADDKNVKIVNGKRLVYVKEMGSNVGRWVEEGTPEAGNVLRSNQDGLRRMQDNGADVHQEGFPSGGR